MTCAYVLGLIDVGPFADYPRAHLDAAWQHARQCATCGPALKAAIALTADLAALPEPAPSRDMATATLARIAVAVASPTTTVPSKTRDWSLWAAVLGGLGAGLGTIVWEAQSKGVLMAPRGFGGMAVGLGAIPSIAMETLLLLAGLVLYVAGLFAPLSSRSRS